MRAKRFAPSGTFLKIRIVIIILLDNTININKISVFLWEK